MYSTIVLVFVRLNLKLGVKKDEFQITVLIKNIYVKCLERHCNDLFQMLKYVNNSQADRKNMKKKKLLSVYTSYVNKNMALALFT